MQSSNDRYDAPRSVTRRYVIDRTNSGDFFLTWRGGRWIVEQQSHGQLWQEFTLAEFDASEAGKRLAAQLDQALRAAETDV